MRVFIALELDDSAKKAVHRVTSRVQRHAHQGAFYPKDNLHLTLRFIGEVDALAESSPIDDLKIILQSVAKDFSAVPYTIETIGTFQKKNRHIVWAGVSQGLDTLSALARILESHLVTLGYPPANPPFAAHITIGRNVAFDGPSGETVVPAEAALAELNEIAIREGLLPHKTVATRLTLMESLRVDGILCYKPVFSVPFRP